MIFNLLITFETRAQIAIQLTASDYNGFHVSCFGVSDGAIDLTISGGTPPYSIIWSTTDTTEDLSGLPAGYYRVTVDDADTLTPNTEGEITLTEPRKLQLGVNAYRYPNGHHISLYDACNSSLTVLALDGVSPYTWLWNDGSTAIARSALCAGTYAVTVTDANGCREQDPKVILTQPDRSDWQMGGNTGSDPAFHFIGTADNKDLVFKANSTEVLRLETGGTIQIPSLVGNGTQNLVTDSSGRISLAPGASWSTNGNNPVPGDYVGTFTNEALVFRTNNTNRLTLSGTGTLTIHEYDDNSGESGLLNVDEYGIIQRVLFNQNTPNKFLNAAGSFTDLPSGSNAWSLNGNTVYSLHSGNVGIGTTTPVYRLDVLHYTTTGNSNGIILKNTSGSNFNSEIKFSNNSNALWSLGCDVTHSGSRNFFIYDNFSNNQSGEIRFYIDEDGRVGIGTIPPTSWTNTNNVQYKLYVADGIATRDVKVQAAGWPDYVFDNTYKRLSIPGLHQYIKTNKHLPGMQSSDGIATAGGFELGAFYVKLLEKVEEQALYIIDLHQSIESLQWEVDQLKKQK